MTNEDRAPVLVHLTPLDLELSGVLHQSFRDAGREELSSVVVGCKLVEQIPGAFGLQLVCDAAYSDDDGDVVAAAMGAVARHLTLKLGLDWGDRTIVARGPRSWDPDDDSSSLADMLARIVEKLGNGDDDG